MHSKKQKGFGLVEVVIASGLMSLAFIAILGALSLYLRSAFQNTLSIRAGLLIEEGIEATLYARDVSWVTYLSPIPMNTPRYFSFNGSLWIPTAVNTYIDGTYERSFILENVYRDAATSNIVTSGGTLDAGTKKLTVSVSWKGQSGTTTRSIATYIGNFYND